MRRFSNCYQILYLTLLCVVLVEGLPHPNLKDYDDEHDPTQQNDPATRHIPDTRFNIVRRSMTWSEAVTACHNKGWMLAIFHTREEAKNTVEQIRKLSQPFYTGYGEDEKSFEFPLERRYWIGLTDVTIEGEWSWLGGGTLFKEQWTFTPGQPDHYKKDTTTHCATLWNPNFESGHLHLLDDDDCTRKYYAICSGSPDDTSSQEDDKNSEFPSPRSSVDHDDNKGVLVQIFQITPPAGIPQIPMPEAPAIPVALVPMPQTPPLTALQFPTMPMPPPGIGNPSQIFQIVQAPSPPTVPLQVPVQLLSPQSTNQQNHGQLVILRDQSLPANPMSPSPNIVSVPMDGSGSRQGYSTSGFYKLVPVDDPSGNSPMANSIGQQQSFMQILQTQSGAGAQPQLGPGQYFLTPENFSGTQSGSSSLSKTVQLVPISSSAIDIQNSVTRTPMRYKLVPISQSGGAYNSNAYGTIVLVS